MGMGAVGMGITTGNGKGINRLNLGSGMGMNHLEWTGLGLKKTFPLSLMGSGVFKNSVAGRKRVWGTAPARTHWGTQHVKRVLNSC